jgi:hypothetical protein
MSCKAMANIPSNSPVVIAQDSRTVKMVWNEMFLRLCMKHHVPLKLHSGMEVYCDISICFTLLSCLHHHNVTFVACSKKVHLCSYGIPYRQIIGHSKARLPHFRRQHPTWKHQMSTKP